MARFGPPPRLQLFGEANSATLGNEKKMSKPLESMRLLRKNPLIPGPLRASGDEYDCG